MEAAYKSLIKSLECPICINYMKPPIKQCSTGHSICNACSTRLPMCPLCQSDFTDSRNLTLESIAENTNYPCINKAAGCTKLVACMKLDQHEKDCAFRGVKCGMENCAQVLYYEQIEEHWLSKKMTSKPYQMKNLCHSKLKDNTFYVNLVKAHDKLFWFKFKEVSGQLYFVVQYLGARANVEHFYYEIEIFKPDRPRTRMILSDYCQLADTEHKQLFTPSKCMNVKITDIAKFLGKDQVLLYYMSVHPTTENNASKPPPQQNVPKRNDSQKKDEPKSPDPKENGKNEGKKVFPNKQKSSKNKNAAA